MNAALLPQLSRCLRRPALGFGLFLLSACAVTPPPRLVPAAVAGSDRIAVDPAVLVGELENGLSYYVRANGRPEKRAEIHLVVDAGSLQEDPDQRGLAHFVEHMAFNGTRRFAKHEIVDYLQSLGMRFGADVNASTGFDETTYTLTVPTDDPAVLEKAFEILADWAQGIRFEPEEVERERGVVVEEWRLDLGAETRLLERQFPVLFRGSRYAERLPIGDKDILEQAPVAALERFYRDWYRPNLMAVVAVGDFAPDTIVGLVGKHLSKRWGPAEPRARETYPVPDHVETLFSLDTDPETTDTVLTLYTKVPAAVQGGRAQYRESLVENLYHTLLSGRLDEVARGEDPPFLFAVSASGQLVRSKGVIYQAVATRSGGVLRGLEALLTETSRVLEHGFTAGELARAKADMLRSYEQAALEKDRLPSAALAAEYTRAFLTGEPIPGIAAELALVQELLPGIEVAELDALARRWITEENRVLLVTAPEKDAATLPAEAELTGLLGSVASRPVAPYEDRVHEAPLLATLPTPGPVVAEQRRPELGLTEWTLANGVSVVLKPTENQRDELLLAGTSPGGTSLLPDELAFTAELASAILAEGGLGSFDLVALDKALAGKAVTVSTNLEELSEEVRGKASPRDAETLFQLLYLSFTAPRADERAFEVFRARLHSYAENRLASPEAVFGDKIQEVLAQGHPRRRPLTPERVDELSLAAALAIHKERFGDAADFQFVIVGNFEPAALRPLVETYLGGLPAAGREESWRDLGLRPPSGQVRFDVAKGLEPKSQVVFVFDRAIPWSRAGHTEARTLAMVLEERLHDVLREELGATYGVGVEGRLAWQPYERSHFNLSFSCAPENVEKLIARVRAEIAAFQAGAVDPLELANAKRTQLREREVALGSNAFWLDALAELYAKGEDPAAIHGLEGRLAAITPESLAAAARTYLDLEHHVVGVLGPER